jgi:uncharacterized membrane protein
MKVESKSLLFLLLIFAIFCVDYARRQYVQTKTKNENEGFSKASEAAKMTGQIILFIILTLILYVLAGFIGSMLLSNAANNPTIFPMIAALATAPPSIAYFLSFVLIN